MFKWFSKLIKGDQPQDKQTNEPAQTGQKQKPIHKERIWKKEVEPLRQLILWGWNKEKQPSLLFLYGKHEFAGPAQGGGNLLREEVSFDSYAIFDGGQGHLPSFPAVKIIDEGDYYERKRKEEFPKMYYKTGLKTYWQKDNDYLVTQFTKLGDKAITLPYFAQLDYEQLVAKITSQHKDFAGFTLAQNPNELLQLNNELAVYYPDCCQLLGHTNLYLRKKALKNLLDSNPPAALYAKLVAIGSTEMLAGLFLELAQRNNGILLESAEQYLATENGWAGKNYDEGVKRCARIYVNSLQPEQRKLRTDWLKKHVPDIDLPLVSLRGKKLAQATELEGINYRKYSLQGYLQEYSYNYDYEKREVIKKRVPELYKPNHFNDGVSLNTLELKNLIQEAECLQLADVLGKVAYYLDAPRLTYYFKGNGKGKELKYYQKYVRRAIDKYAQTKPALFMQAMKSLLTSYTPADYVCKFKGNFQFNYFIKHYLYYDFTEKPPYGWDNWYARHNWLSQDQLLKLTGRHEYAKEIWTNNLPDVLYIAINTQVETITKACYYILKEPPEGSAFLQNLPYKELVALCEVSYQPLAQLATQIFQAKLAQATKFDAQLMLALLGSPNPAMHKTAHDFYNRTQGAFQPEELVEFFFLPTFEQCTEFLQSNLLALASDKYADFVVAMLAQSDRLSQAKLKPGKEMEDILSFSTSLLKEASLDKKQTVLAQTIAMLLQKNNLPNWLQAYWEDVLFVLPLAELKSMLEKTSLTKQDITSASSAHILAMLEAVKTGSLPSDAQLVNILEKATAKTIHTLVQLAAASKQKLCERLTTILLLLETQVIALNQLAQELFAQLPKEKQAILHQMVIDSPVSKVYLFGLEQAERLYPEALPLTFIRNMLEHPAPQVRAYVADKAAKIFDNLAYGDEQLFIYYAKSIFLLPNKLAKAKEQVYLSIPLFAKQYPEKAAAMQMLLEELGGSNVRADAERALITLAQMKKEAV